MNQSPTFALFPPIQAILAELDARLLYLKFKEEDYNKIKPWYRKTYTYQMTWYYKLRKKILIDNYIRKYATLDMADPEWSG